MFVINDDMVSYISNKLGVYSHIKQKTTLCQVLLEFGLHGLDLIINFQTSILLLKNTIAEQLNIIFSH